VFGAHFLDATDALFAEADALGLRITAGLVVSDRDLRADLLVSAARAYDVADEEQSHLSHRRVTRMAIPDFLRDLLTATGPSGYEAPAVKRRRGYHDL